MILGWLPPAALAATLSGGVFADPDGAPLVSATVVAYDLRLDYRTATTDAQGHWQLDELPAGTWRVLAVAAAGEDRVARFHPSERGFCDSPPFSLDDTDVEGDVDVRLPAGGRLDGTLLDGDGQPVSGATLTAIATDQSTWSRQATSDGDGRFSIGGLDAPASGETDWVCAVSAEGWPDQYLDTTYDSEEAVIYTVPELSAVDTSAHRLLDGILVGGQATGPDGPLQDATVYVYAGGQITTVQSDADGIYEAGGLPPGDVLPWVSATDHAVTYYPDADRPEDFLLAEEGDVIEDADLQAPYQATFAARFVDEHTGEALPGLQGLLYNDTHTVGRGNSAGDDGVLVIDRLHGGDYTLYAWGSSEGLTDDWVRDPDGEVHVFELTPEVDAPTVDVELPRAAEISGRVQDDAGAPVYGATVLLSRADGQRAYDATDRDGLFRVDGLPAGDWRLSVTTDPYCPTDPGYVRVYLDDQVNPDWQGLLGLAEGEWRDGLVLTSPRDDDHDGMADAWERSWGLDPSRDDSGEDPDEDGYDNGTEYLLDTPPVGGASGCLGGRGAWLLLPLLGLARRERRAR